MSVRKNNTVAIRLDARLASTLDEVADHVDANTDEAVERPRTETVEMLLRWYVSEYPEAFEAVGDGQYRYVGGRGGSE